MSHTLFKYKVLPHVEKGVPTIWLVIDNLRLDQWKAIQPIFAETFRIQEEESFYSILPTATQYSRNAVFAAMLARGNIAIHVRLKGEMSEACIGLEPKGWAYVASLIKEERATGVNVYIDEPYPQIAENPPVVVASSFSLTSLFK